MSYKKLLISFIVFFSAGIFGWNFFRATPTVKNIHDTAPQVTVVLNAGESIATYSGIMAATAYTALTEAASSAAIPIEKKQYDFGVFIEKIGEYGNTQEYAWIYYVNGAAGDVASDKKIIQEGDIVEWRYEKPLY
jgi:hypothetical protein